MSETNGYATLDEFLAAGKKPRRTKDLTLPVSGLKVKIQSLSEREKSEYETEGLSRDGSKQVMQRLQDARRRLIQRCLLEPKIEKQHIEMLGEFDGRDLSYLGDECAAFVGFSKEDMEKLEGN